MAHFKDWKELGVFPLQDHDPLEVPLGMRLQMAGARIARAPDPAGTIGSAEEALIEIAKQSGKGTMGDLHPWLFWQTDDRGKRPTGSWSSCFAALATKTPQAARYGTVVQPAKGPGFDNDVRYTEVLVQPPKGMSGIPAGSQVLMVPVTEERAQYVAPLQIDPRLVAPNVGGPYTMGTLVVDLQPDGHLCMNKARAPGRGGRQALLQSVFRVVAMPTQGVSSPTGTFVEGSDKNIIALQYGTGSGGVIGQGAVFTPMDADSSGPLSPRPNTGQPTGGTTGGTTTPISGGSGERLSGRPAGSLLLGGEEGEGELLGASSAGTSGSIGTGAFGALAAAEGGTVAAIEEDPPKTPHEFGEFQAKPAGTAGVALMEAVQAGGPIHGGHLDDRHHLGRDADGNPINSAHISTGALFYRDKDRDGALRFEGDFPGASSFPLRAHTHLTWDGALELWRWWTEVPVMSPETPVVPPTPTPSPQPTTPRPTGPTTPGPSGPQTPGPSTPQPTGPTTPGPTGPTTPGPHGPGSGSPGAGTGSQPTTPGGRDRFPWITENPPSPSTPGAPPPSTGGPSQGGTPPADPPPLQPTTPGPQGPTTPEGFYLGPSYRPDPPPADPDRTSEGSLIPGAPHPEGWQGEGFPGGQPTWPGGFSNRSARANGFRNAVHHAEYINESLGFPAGRGFQPEARYPGVVNRVGETNADDVGAYAVHQALGQSFQAVYFRPQLWVSGYPSFEHNPEVGSNLVANDEVARPHVLGMRAWGSQADGDWNYTIRPRESRARGGAVDGGILFSPPEWELEDYFGIDSTEDVTASQTAGYVTVAPQVSFALGTPNIDGGLDERAGTFVQDIANANHRLRICQHDSSRAAVALINMELDQSTSERHVQVPGFQGLRIPRGTTAQRPTAFSLPGFVRMSTDAVASTDSVEYYDSQNATWRRVAHTGTLAEYLPLGGGTMTGAILAATEAQAYPSISFSDSPTTGFSRRAADDIGIVIAGSTLGSITSSGIGWRKVATRELEIWSPGETAIVSGSNSGAHDAWFIAENAGDALDSWAWGRRNDGDWELRHDTAGTFGDGTQTLAMTVRQSNQYVGIGTHNPVFFFHVNSAGVNFVSCFESTDSVAAIRLRDSSDDVDFYATAGVLTIRPSSTEVMSLSSTYIDCTGTTEGFGVPKINGDPDSPNDGDIWYDTSTDTYRGSEGGTLVTFDTTDDVT